MTQSVWQFNLYALPLFIITVIAALFFIYSIQRLHYPAALPFAAICFCTLVWTFGAALQVSTNNLQVALGAAHIQQIGYTLIAPSWFLFACLFTGRQGWLKRNRLISIYILPVIMLLFFWTNQQHSLMFTDARIVSFPAGNNLLVTFNTLFWVHTAIAYSLIVTGSGLILNYVFSSDRAYRQQWILLVIASVVPLVSNVINIMQLNPLLIDLTPLAFGISMFCFAISVFRFKLLDLVPLSYENLLTTLKEGVIVLDPYNRIVHINPAALQLLGQRSSMRAYCWDGDRSAGCPLGRYAQAVSGTERSAGRSENSVAKWRSTLVFNTGFAVDWAKWQTSTCAR